MPLHAVNWGDVCNEATEHLRALLRLDTTNPPGNEIIAVNYIKEVLDKEGIEYTILEPAPTRANIVARVKGTGEKQPMLLSGHTDVVPAESECWTEPPFSAAIRDNCIYGRGAIDMKNMVAMSLMTVILAKRLGTPLKRDLIFAAIADEEVGCTHGSRFLVEEHPDLIRAEYLLTEVGGFSTVFAGKTFYPVQIAEKGTCWLRLTFTGEPGHGSIPSPNSAVVQAAKAAEQLGRVSFPLRMTKAAGIYINALESHLPGIQSFIINKLRVPFISEFLCDYVLPKKRTAQTLKAILHNTATPTVLKAGEKTNVVPGSASIDIDGRILPGVTLEEFIDELRDIIGNDFTYEVLNHTPGSEHDVVQDPIFAKIEQIIGRHDPSGSVIPYMIPGFTDASYYHKLGMKCVGFSPVKLRPEMEFAELFHGHNERIPVDGFHFGVRALAETVLEFASE